MRLRLLPRVLPVPRPGSAPIAPPERIVLVGFMGAGKTTVGQRLAEKLGWTFRDLDAWIEERLGRTIAEVFRTDGEEFFREEERRAAEDVGSLRSTVVAAGGGAFTRAATREALRRESVTVWLRCDLDAVLLRVGRDASRPLAGDRERMLSLLADREPSYRLADVIVDTTDVPPEEVADRIVRSVFPEAEKQTGR